VDIRRELQEIVPQIPLVGERFDRALARLRDGLQTALTPGGLFVELGFHYYGPVDGHNIRELVDAFHDLRRVEGPVLLHAVTEKGHGFRPASQDPTKFHSSKRFEFANGTLRSEETAAGDSYSRVFGRAICELAEQNPEIVAITAAMPDGTALTEFEERFPERFHNVGICEQHATGLANGLSAAGVQPVFAVYSTFLQRAFDQLYHDIALQGSHAVFCIDRAGLVGADGPTHHGLNDISYCRSMPGFVVMAPKDGHELEAMLRLAVGLEGPAAIRYPRESAPQALPCPASDRDAPLEVGRAEVCLEGSDGVIVAYGAIVQRALRAARLLNEEGLSVGVINARFAAPLDRETICAAVGDHPLVLLAEDHRVRGGFGSAVLEALAEEGVSTNHVRLAGVPMEVISHATRERQLARCELDGPGLAARVKRLSKELRTR
jgi:1-deoxy-D-xylulose-5-phosphate synthase